MPVTAKLSRKFYETFGDEIANELVNWFNAVDDAYRSDLKELNQLNFARFDAKLEQRLAQFETKLEQHLAQLERHLMRWMVGLLVPTMLGVIGLAVGVFLRG
ncbi:MAG: hypothetical protein HY700_02160 [Gemmatimonadetes bacterium]|nr:hypothetical protein [Gemmatimonadota bacterium]